MFQKSRSIWSYVAMHYLEDHDYFHLAGDDMHMIVENFRSLMLLEYEAEGYMEQNREEYLGSIKRKQAVISSLVAVLDTQLIVLV